MSFQNLQSKEQIHCSFKNTIQRAKVKTIFIYLPKLETKENLQKYRKK